MKLGDRIKGALKRATTRFRFAKNRPRRFSKAERNRRRHNVTKWKRALAALRRRQAARRRALRSRLWGGSRAVTNEVIRIVGKRATVTSRKRWELFGNPDSDHYRGNLTADAVDFGIGEAYWLAREIAKGLGAEGEWTGDYDSFLIKRNGRWYRVQIIAGTHGTGPHLHVGVKLV